MYYLDRKKNEYSKMILLSFLYNVWFVNDVEAVDPLNPATASFQQK